MSSENYKQLQQGLSSIFLMGGCESHPHRKSLRKSKLGMKTRNYSSKSWYEALTPKKLAVLKDSVSYELWLPGSTELVEEHDDIPCFMKLPEMSFWKTLS